MEPEEREHRELNATVGSQIHEEYWLRVGAFLEDLGELPFEARTGITQAIADFLGCRVILQAAVMESIPNAPDVLRIICEVMRADPAISHALYE